MTMENRGKEALVIVDMLNDFVLPGAPLEVPEARTIVEAIRARAEKARSRSDAVIYLCDAHDPNDKEFGIWPKHAVKDTPGAQVIDELAPEKGDLVIPKTTYSGFYGTDLEKTIRERGITGIMLAGILTNVCIYFTAADAVMRGLRVRVGGDSVAALAAEEHEFALDQLEKVLRVEIV
jgi:nicotinamidase-related amidase